MEEIEVKDNPLGIKVFVVGKPDIEHMPKEEFDLFVSLSGIADERIF